MEQDLPDALRLASELDACPSISYRSHAAELRRQHAELAALQEQSPVAWRTRDPMREHWALTDDAYLASCRRAFGHTVIPLYAASAPSPVKVTAPQTVDPLP